MFHGHDHLYAKQELDGIIYQEVPQPGNSGSGRVPPYAAEYGYVSGTILGGSGHMRVSVSTRQVTSEYVLSGVPGDKSARTRNRTVADSYVILAR